MYFLDPDGKTYSFGSIIEVNSDIELKLVWQKDKNNDEDNKDNEDDDDNNYIKNNEINKNL